MTRRVVITGLGAMTPLGPDVESLWLGLRDGRTGMKRISRFDATGYPCRIAAEVLSLPEGLREGGRLPVDWMACAAAEQAWRDAGGRSRGRRCGLGLSLGWEDREIPDERESGRGLRLSRSLEEFRNLFELQGPMLSCFSACAAGTQLVEEAVRCIRLGEADMFLAGASDSRIHPLGLWGYARLGALATDFNDEPGRGSRPFDRKRSGFVMGEGAGFVVLEEREQALARGAKIYAEILGAASTCDAFSVTAPREDGKIAARSVTRCLERAGVRPGDLDYINAHGTSTQANDAAEVATLKTALGPAARNIPVGSFKSMIGHLAMASGVVEIIGTVMAMRHGIVPPNLNLEEPDFDLNFAGSRAREFPLRRVLKTSFGFGGQNSSILLGSEEA